MKQILTLTIVISLVSLKAFATTTQCVGVYDENRGSKITLEAEGNSYRLVGTSVVGEGFNGTQNCVGNYTNQSRDKKYNVYSATTPSSIANKTECSVGYVKLMPSALSPSGGMLVLARTSGGDNHDSSGYSYRYYHCSTQNQ